MQNLDTQVIVGLVAALIIVVSMAGYARVIFAGREISRARMGAMEYPKNVEDVRVTTPLPDSMAEIDGALRADGFVLASERRGMQDPAGARMATWHYRNADSTAHALVALSADGREAGLVVTTFFEDDMQLVTRLSRSVPKIEKPDFESHSVERAENAVRVHNGHIQRLAASHGKPLSLATFEDEQRIAEKTYKRARGYLFDAMWRRSMIWLAAVEGVGLLALIGGLVQLFNPTLAPIRGLAMLMGGAALLGILAISGAVALRRIGKQQPQGK